ncbi:MAG: hypothetical protein ACOCYO_07210 [Bacteroidota bacterium]
MIEVKQVSVRRHFIVKILVVIFGITGAVLLMLVLTRGSSDSILKTFDVPAYVRIIVLILGLVFVFTTLALLSLKDKQMGVITFFDNYINLPDFNRNIMLSNIENAFLSINPHPNKPIHYREITSFGGNNWLEIEEQNGETHRYEFLIRSEKQEKEILELVEKWRENGLNVEVGKSPKMFWEIFM